jgi:uncharacterized protein YehS (DUF1456 family)
VVLPLRSIAVNEAELSALFFNISDSKEWRSIGDLDART